MPFALDKLVNKVHRDKSFQDLVKMPINTLKGVSEGDADLLKQAFGIETISDFAGNPFVLAAQSIHRASMDNEYDAGPPPFWLEKFAGLSDDFFLNHPSNRFRTAFGGVLYRGRLDDTAKVLVIGQDPSTDEAISRRAFTGSAGQRLQMFLNRVGITRSYTIMNTFAYSIKGQFDSEMRSISLEAPLKNFREDLIDTILERNPIQAILTFGAGARHAIENWQNSNKVKIFELVHPTAPENITHPNWNGQLSDIANFLEPDDPSKIDLTPYSGRWNKAVHLTDIPRFDLPYDIPAWHGTDGTNSRRDPADRVKNIIWESV